MTIRARLVFVGVVNAVESDESKPPRERRTLGFVRPNGASVGGLFSLLTGDGVTKDGVENERERARVRVSGVFGVKGSAVGS